MYRVKSEPSMVK